MTNTEKYSQKKVSSQFRKLSVENRLKEIESLHQFSNRGQQGAGLNARDIFYNSESLSLFADKTIECAIGTLPIPIGIVPNLPINDTLFHIPLATEESSVIAGASYASKIFSIAGIVEAVANDKEAIEGVIKTGSIKAQSKPAIQIAQIALRGVSKSGERQFLTDIEAITDKLLVNLASMHKRGGGLRNIEYKRIQSGTMKDLFVVHLLIDVRDAMGANISTQVAEFIAPDIAHSTGGKVLASILSNFSVERCAEAEICLDINKLPNLGMPKDEVARNIDAMYRWAYADIYRASTHNKGIMNGVSALALSTGNDGRAIETAAHTLASNLSTVTFHQHSSGAGNIQAHSHYMPLSKWEFFEDTQTLKGNIIIPALFATKGGATSLPYAQWAQSLLGTNYKKALNAPMLNRIAAGLGLAQNFAALLALSTEGIQKGHMKLHKRKHEL